MIDVCGLSKVRGGTVEARSEEENARSAVKCTVPTDKTATGSAAVNVDYHVHARHLAQSSLADCRHR